MTCFFETEKISSNIAPLSGYESSNQINYVFFSSDFHVLGFRAASTLHSPPAFTSNTSFPACFQSSSQQWHQCQCCTIPVDADGKAITVLGFGFVDRNHLSPLLFKVFNLNAPVPPASETEALNQATQYQNSYNQAFTSQSQHPVEQSELQSEQLQSGRYIFSFYSQLSTLLIVPFLSQW